MAKRVLVLSASVGSGHMRAAQAVELALPQLDPEAVVENRDILELTNAAFRRIYLTENVTLFVCLPLFV